MADYNPFLTLGLNAFQQAQQPFDTQWLDKVSQSLYDQSNYNYNTNLKPGLNANAITAGGYGGDRAKLAEGVVMDRMNQNVVNAMAPQYANAYQNWANRGLQAGQASASTGLGVDQQDLNRTLGLGNLGVNQYQADTSRQLGLGQLGLGYYGADTQRQLGLGNLGVNQMVAQNQAAYQAAQAANPQYANPWGAAIGGGLGLAQLLNILSQG
jgi:hypothetical protein